VFLRGPSLFLPPFSISLFYMYLTSNRFIFRILSIFSAVFRIFLFFSYILHPFYPTLRVFARITHKFASKTPPLFISSILGLRFFIHIVLSTPLFAFFLFFYLIFTSRRMYKFLKKPTKMPSWAYFLTVKNGYFTVFTLLFYSKFLKIAKKRPKICILPQASTVSNYSISFELKISKNIKKS
jgi:hypothetical protein